MGLDRRLQRGRTRQAGLQLDNSRPHLRHLSRSAACGPTCEIGFMPKALSIKPEPYQHHWTAAATIRRHLHRLGLSAEGLREMGRTRSTNGRSIASRDTAAPRSRRGIGKSGTSRTSVTGAARRRNFSSCTITRSTACGARCRPRGSAGRTRRAAAAGSRAIFSSIACAAPITPPARSARRSISSPSTPRARRAFIDGHVRMGIAQSTAHDRRRLPASSPRFPN